MIYNPSEVVVTINGEEVKGFAEDISICREVFIIYGKENCEFCEKAKALLEAEVVRFEYIEVGKDITKDELIEKCARFGVIPKTVPQIFKVSHGVVSYIGGYTDLVEETI